jgi:hypothetical protein
VDGFGRSGERGLEGLPGFNEQDKIIVPAESDFDSRGTKHLVERIKHGPCLGVIAYQERDVRASRGFDFVGFTVEHGFVWWGVKLGDFNKIAEVIADRPGKFEKLEVAFANNLVVRFERSAEGRDDFHKRVVVSFGVEFCQRDSDDDGGDADFVFHWFCLVGGEIICSRG